jgi:S-adenosylmethionine uptake transporter
MRVKPVFSPALIMLAAVGALSAMDATIKFLTATNHVLGVTLGRYALGAFFSVGIWLRAGSPRITAEMWRAHWARGFVIAISATSFFWSLTVLPLAEAVTLSFVAPLIVPFAAWLMVGERPRPSSLIAAGLGFIGVLVAVQGAPAEEADSRRLLGVLAVLLAAATFAVSITLMRARARTDDPAIIGLLAAFIPGLIVAVPAIVVSAPPPLADIPLFLLMGVLGAGGMYLMARAYGGAEAQQLAPLHYSEFLWATLLGYLIFNETPRLHVFAGAALIVLACLFAAWDERRLSIRSGRNP